MIVMPLLYGPNFSFSADGKFQYPSIVIIPNYVTSLTGDSSLAFDSHIEIKEIIFEKGSSITSLPIGLFEDCAGLKIVHNLPENLISLGTYAFNRCYELEEIFLPETLTDLGSYTFQNCQVLEDISLPKGIIAIPAYCFYNSGLKNLKRESVITSLGTYCFYSCSNLEDELANSLLEEATSYGTYSFSLCHGLENIKTKGANVRQFFGCDNLQRVEINGNINGTVLGEYAFADCKKLKEVIFTEDCLYTSFGRDIFENCESLETIILPNTLTTLNVDTFENCYSLKEIQMPNSLVSLGNYCFYNCTNLEKVILGPNVKTIPYQAFYNCSNLKSINLENIMSLAEYCFQGAFDLADVTIPGNITTIGKNAFNGCKLKQLILEEGIQTLGEACFRDCPNLTSAILPNTLTTINATVFYNDTNLEKISIPDSVINFNNNSVFGYCSKLKEVSLSKQMTNLPSYTFEYCTSLKEITLPESLITINADAFRYSGIETIYLGANVSSISTNAFRYCSYLKDLYFNKQKDSLTVPTNKWGATNATIHWLTSTINFTSNADLFEAKIFIEDNEVKNLSYKTETVGEVSFKAYHPDYLPLMGTTNINPPKNQTLDLQFSAITEDGIEGAVFSVVPQIDNCNISLTVDGVTFNSSYVTVLPGTEVIYSITGPNKELAQGSVIVNETLSLAIPENIFIKAVD